MSGFSAGDYGALADITSDGVNAEILRELKNDNPEFTELWVGVPDNRRSHQYAIEDARGMGMLGDFVGHCTNVTNLALSLPEYLDSGIIAPFFVALERNRSIETLHIVDSHVPRDFFRMLTPFIKANSNLVAFYVNGCWMDAEQYRALSSALREGKSLKHFMMTSVRVVGGRYDHEQSIIANFEALKMHPRLERLHFRGFAMGENVCSALSDLLRHSVGLQIIVLWNNRIDDSGIEALVDGLAHCKSLREFYLLENRSITADGWRALASLLEDPNSSLKTLHLCGNGINNESAVIFANALARNKSLELLNLHLPVEYDRGSWKAFSKVLCDTSSVNATFLSNHTLRYLTAPSRTEDHLPDDIRSSLRLNRENGKKAAAIRKILLYHDNLDMQPLFEWDLKLLPLVVEWLDRAAVYGLRASRGKRQLSAIYQFMIGMPELAIEGITGVKKKSAHMVGAKRTLSSS